MSGSWIKVRTSLVKDGRIRVASRLCHVDTVTLLGGVVTLWSLGDQYADDDGVLYGWTKEDIDAEIGIPGLCDALPNDWIDLSGEWVKLPEYQEHNGTTAKSRAQATKRQQKKRAVTPPSRTDRDNGVTREDKNRGDKEKGTNVPQKKGERLPHSTLPDDWLTFATEEGHDSPTTEFNKFHDYWIAQPGQKGVKLDWFATWRNWIRRSIDDHRNRSPRNDSASERAARLAEQREAERSAREGNGPIVATYD